MVFIFSYLFFFLSLSFATSSLFFSLFLFQFFVSLVNFMSLPMATPDILTTNQLSSAELW